MESYVRQPGKREKAAYHRGKQSYKKWKQAGVLAGIVTSILILGIIYYGFEINNHGVLGLISDWKRITPIESAAEAFPGLTIEEDYLRENPYSRPGIALEKVDKIVVHYTGNPATTAQANRDYFESLADSGLTYASSHFVIDLDGTILQCIPLNEISYASNHANSYSISIECCHPDESGEFTTETYNRCVALVGELCKYYRLDPEEDVIRHYDVTGKECPVFYVRHPEEWEAFLDYIKEYISGK